jgi:hypothetical protein
MNKRPRKQPFRMKFLQKTPPKQSCFGAGSQPYKNHELNIISENSTAKRLSSNKETFGVNIKPVASASATAFFVNRWRIYFSVFQMPHRILRAFLNDPRIIQQVSVFDYKFGKGQVELYNL